MENINESKKTIKFSIIGNIIVSIIKGAAGIFGNSYALIADAIESVADVFSSIIVLLGINYTSKPADEDHPYGHGRAEPLITFIVVMFLIIAAVVIGYDSIKSFYEPATCPESWTLWLLGVLIIWKEYSYRKVMKKGNETNSSSIKADAWHHRSDAITSVAAFIGISIAIIGGKDYWRADAIAALFASVFILYNSYIIFRPALGDIMDEHVHNDLVSEIRTIAESINEIDGTEKCYVRKVGSKYWIDLHILVNSNMTVKEGHDITRILKKKLTSEINMVEYVLIHVEPHDSEI